jgi:hypothetical protein
MPAELRSILTTGGFSNIAGVETKYFSTSLQGARPYAAQAGRIFGDGPFTIVRTSMPGELDHGRHAGHSGWQHRHNDNPDNPTRQAEQSAGCLVRGCDEKRP